MAHVSPVGQLPLLVRHRLMAVQTSPVPEYPVVHVHVLVAAPVETHVAFVSHPPLSTRQLLTPVQVVPLPE
jgi:hypothetical protein